VFRDRVTQILLDKISEASKKIRAIEDDSQVFSVAPMSNGVYTALVGYRRALQEVLEDLRSIDDSDTTSGN